MSTLRALTESSARGEPSAKRMRPEGGGGSIDSAFDKYKRHSKELTLTLFENLGRIWSQIHEQSSRGASSSGSVSSVEVEIRVGMLISQDRRYTPQLTLPEPKALPVDTSRTGLEFKAGVDEAHMQQVKMWLSKKGWEAAEQPVSRLRVNNKGQRWEVGGKNGSTVLRAETKKKFYQVDLALLGHACDLRINAAVESSVPGPASASASGEAAGAGARADEVSSSSAGSSSEMESSSSSSSSSSSGPGPGQEDSWTQQRLKRRTSYSCKGAAWRVDVTDVEVAHRRPAGEGGSSSGGGSSSTTREMEVEIELDAAYLQRWRAAKPEALPEETSTLARQLADIIHTCIPSSIEQSTERPLEPLTSNLEQLKAGIRDINHRLRVASGQEAFTPDFIGSMPVNLTRKNLGVVMSNAYYVTEKTDGVRYMLYVVSDGTGPAAILRDRKGALYRAPGSALIGAALGLGTVLDGEMVFNRTYKKQVYLIFDVLAVGASPKLQLPFSSRMEIISTEVNDLCRAYLEAPSAASSGAPADTAIETPLWLIRKVFRKKIEVGEIVSKLRTESGERVYFENERRHHKSDGIIFQPDAPYVMGAFMECFKWKWLEMRSVDLQAVANLKAQNELRLFAKGPESTEIDCMLANTVALAAFDTYRLRADMAEANLPRPIIEVTYDVLVGTWRYHHIRKDKREPNGIQTVIGVMLELAEQIPIEELEYAFLSGGVSSDFPSQMAKMKTQLLDWKRKR